MKNDINILINNFTSLIQTNIIDLNKYIEKHINFECINIDIKNKVELNLNLLNIDKELLDVICAKLFKDIKLKLKEYYSCLEIVLDCYRYSLETANQAINSLLANSLNLKEENNCLLLNNNMNFYNNKLNLCNTCNFSILSGKKLLISTNNLTSSNSLNNIISSSNSHLNSVLNLKKNKINKTLKDNIINSNTKETFTDKNGIYNNDINYNNIAKTDLKNKIEYIVNKNNSILSKESDIKNESYININNSTCKDRKTPIREIIINNSMNKNSFNNSKDYNSKSMIMQDYKVNNNKFNTFRERSLNKDNFDDNKFNINSFNESNVQTHRINKLDKIISKSNVIDLIAKISFNLELRNYFADKYGEGSFNNFIYKLKKNIISLDIIDKDLERIIKNKNTSQNNNVDNIKPTVKYKKNILIKKNNKTNKKKLSQMH